MKKSTHKYLLVSHCFPEFAYPQFLISLPSALQNIHQLVQAHAALMQSNVSHRAQTCKRRSSDYFV